MSARVWSFIKSSLKLADRPFVARDLLRFWGRLRGRLGAVAVLLVLLPGMARGEPGSFRVGYGSGPRGSYIELRGFEGGSVRSELMNLSTAKEELDFEILKDRWLALESFGIAMEKPRAGFKASEQLTKVLPQLTLNQAKTLEAVEERLRLKIELEHLKQIMVQRGCLGGGSGSAAGSASAR